MQSSQRCTLLKYCIVLKINTWIIEWSEWWSVYHQQHIRTTTKQYLTWSLFNHSDQQGDTKIITLLEYKTICFGVTEHLYTTDLNVGGCKLTRVWNVGSQNNAPWSWKAFSWLKRVKTQTANSLLIFGQKNLTLRQQASLLLLFVFVLQRNPQKWP